MYAVKPWGKVLLIGGTIGSYALGIGMRWRESYVDIVEKASDPSHERLNHRRCVISQQAVRLLVDMGCTEQNVMRVMSPAQRWRLMTPQLHIIREGDVYAGCSPAEPTYHCEEGALLRVLRSEFLRFGGTVDWGVTAGEAFGSSDGSETWTLRKTYGPGTEAEAIISFAQGAELNSMLVVDDAERAAVLFDVSTGTSEGHSADLDNVFGGKTSVVIAVGEGVALHLWSPRKGTVFWRSVTRGRSSDQHTQLTQHHPLITDMMRTSINVERRPVLIPATVPAIRDDAAHIKVGMACDALLPVDAFEWRGDRARLHIEEASSICRSFYGKKYHRGYVPSLLRGLEQDSLVKRANYVRRDLQDAENFLSVNPLLARTAHDSSASAVDSLPQRLERSSTGPPS